MTPCTPDVISFTMCPVTVLIKTKLIKNIKKKAIVYLIYYNYNDKVI